MGEVILSNKMRVRYTEVKEERLDKRQQREVEKAVKTDQFDSKIGEHLKDSAIFDYFREE